METEISKPVQEKEPDKLLLEHPDDQSTLEAINSDTIPTNETEADNAEQPSPEVLQRKLYFLVEHLKTMHSKLPE